jgi:molybdopterin molybdotransferase
MPWWQARSEATQAAAALPAVTRPLSDAAGFALAAPLTALTDLPAFDTSAMDGWAVSGHGPWRELGGGIMAGEVPGPLSAGTARRIATGAPVPAGDSAVLRLEHGAVTDGVLRSSVPPPPGCDIRPRGQECIAGATLVEAGVTVTPALLGLAAAAGHDELLVHRQPDVQVLVTGSELASSGVPRDGRVRDALSPVLLPWLSGCGARLHGTSMVGDGAGALLSAIRNCAADVIITTGSTSAGPTDVLHPVLGAVGARLLVDSVAVRPGHPMLLAELPSCPSGQPRWLIGLPGNPLAAIAGLMTLALPLLRRLGGHPCPAPRLLALDTAIPGHPRDVRLLPATVLNGRAAVLPFDGPAMLRGVALADALAVVPPGGAAAGTYIEAVGLAG